MTTKIKRPSIAWVRKVLTKHPRDVKSEFAGIAKGYHTAPEGEVWDRLVYLARLLDSLPKCPLWAREKAWACVRDYVSGMTIEHDSGFACPRCGERSKPQLQVSLIAEKHATIQQLVSPIMLRVQLVGCEHYSHHITCATCGLRWPGTLMINVVPGFASEQDESPHDPVPGTDDSKPPN